MKVAVRILGLVIAVAGLTAASMTLPANTAANNTAMSSQATNSALPTPSCGPDMGCSLPTGK